MDLADSGVALTIQFMWGNTLGWCISAIWVAAVVTGVVALRQNLESITPRTEFSRDADHAPLISLPVPPATVLAEMKDDADAGPVYRRAIEAYQKNPFTYDQFARSGREHEIDDVPGIQVLVEAIPYARADLFASDPKRIVNYDAERPGLDALRTLGACARRAGQLIEAKDPAAAMRLYEATFALGDKLYRERLCYAELDAGLTMLAEGSELIRRLSEARGDAARSDHCRRFSQARIGFVNAAILPAQRILGSADPGVIERHAGDVFYYARSGQDRMWRVEAILKLGRYRFNAARVGDQRAAARVVAELAGDPDPVIRAAAVAARDLTQTQYRTLR